MKSQDERYMQEALRLARKGIGWALPNPMVGALLVKNGNIIGKGYYKKFGSAHAEVEAFTHATEDPKGATMYVTLEPHNHYGKTPPCTDAIIAKGIAKVVCAVPDPNPKVNSSGIEKLRKAGIEVIVGVCEEEAKKLNEAFFTFYTKNRPFVTIKFAASLDGKIATKTHDSKWITNDKARQYARKLRSVHQAILVGINTVLHDSPNLGARTKGARDPLRIILDSTLKIPMDSEVLRDNNVLLVTTTRAPEDKIQALQRKGTEVLQIQQEKITVTSILEELYKREIISVFVEGGSEALGSFVDARTVDRFYIFYAPLFIGGRDAISAVRGEGVATVTEALKAKDVTVQKLDDTILLTGTC
jgi:diaminohydroxyphosphoribosylaminopyrimidine deaminase / 5-amino-6-(5-phosphoribosylamino)uracil reductase